MFSYIFAVQLFLYAESGYLGILYICKNPCGTTILFFVCGIAIVYTIAVLAHVVMFVRQWNAPNIILTKRKLMVCPVVMNY